MAAVAAAVGLGAEGVGNTLHAPAVSAGNAGDRAVEVVEVVGVAGVAGARGVDGDSLAEGGTSVLGGPRGIGSGACIARRAGGRAGRVAEAASADSTGQRGACTDTTWRLG
ncbi:hypothetical protein BOTBODRAFT_48478 [Botryobasidium botryosum FD-172 SS1]|uniref:Uncharacterized protein n=1 Tax=Botryobasidium botryosum (strain FD-172 SS1) TaxID=930990 RepID=A0A067LZU0_BOTB1|nr:hypothetical protein BOTBODRAFT_48478 [Botryobasidium botryosum FD-172 SS1]